jgi:hypothetical protein
MTSPKPPEVSRELYEEMRAMYHDADFIGPLLFCACGETAGTFSNERWQCRDCDIEWYLSLPPRPAAFLEGL